jgi:hypothetical protein
MSGPTLPQELIDHIIDLLHHNPKTLMDCCLVSKSWVPRTRTHLFARIRFGKKGEIKSWKKTFPDLTDSPACYARSLRIDAPEDAEEFGCIQAFFRVEQMFVNCGRSYSTKTGHTISLIPLHKFASSLKSLHVTATPLPFSQIINVICFLPLLEDLILHGHDINDEPDGPLPVVPFSSPPALTGTLEIFALTRMTRALGQILDLPGGPHFRKLKLTWLHAPDLPLVAELVTACSDNLEYLNIMSDTGGALHSDPLEDQSLTRASLSRRRSIQPD